MPGIGPLTDALKAFATFFGIDGDLVAAAAERSGAPVDNEASPQDIRQALGSQSESQRLEVLLRLAEGDPQVAADFRRMIGRQLACGTATHPAPSLRKASELRARAQALREVRTHADAQREAERMRIRRDDDAKAFRAKLDAIRSRSDDVWREVEEEIERRNAAGYDRAFELLMALETLADEQATTRAYEGRMASLRERHARKARFLARLDMLE